jgi:putative sigma-54 modulation protein
MNVTYKGIREELPPKLQAKLDGKLRKLSKLLERRGEKKEVHVIVTNERHLQHAEVTVQFYDHQLVGIGSDADLFTALSAALDKLEFQVVKQRARWREKVRRKEAPVKGEAAPLAAAPARTKAAVKAGAKAAAPGSSRPSKDGAGQRVFRVEHHRQKKPMTLEEALIEMEDDQDYLVYQDADKDQVSVLVRRRDGHFDLIES